MTSIVIRFSLIIIGFVMFSCNSVQTLSISDAEGYINAKLKFDYKVLNQLRDDLSVGNSDTCFIYYNAKLFKDHSLEYDSISYQCIGAKILDESILKQFAQELNLKIDEEGSSAIIGFEPYAFALQMTLEVGENKEDTINQIGIGYSRFGDFSLLTKVKK